ncbi:Glycosyl transferase family 2 [Roseovarius azorensis]|uniref:Glycosyl transferase family 2 n=1 Tax=Roseovarius azorensis TaxID=1287727 RepID=A0A1H7FGA1_9RHOB|nr:glycosyltransferase family 2 protein [Roseovarius azorensis]SEK22315.1 Glycosyl transferase family 2 [Roseovarius azorensis]
MTRFIIVTPMKNEGPFILEWVAHNLAIGVDDIAVFSNNCTDGSDALLDRLTAMGKLRHFDNTTNGKLAPQRRAYRRFIRMDLAGPDDWVIPIDADEYINIKVGDHTLRALTGAVPQARTLSMTWRLFGNAGISSYEDAFLTDQFRMAAADMTRHPPQAWGLKTMFRRGLWGHIGIHRPKRPTVETFAQTHWYNGSGQQMPERYMEGSWRSGPDSLGYDLVQLNHYALKSCASYLVKRARGRPHHVGEVLGLEYWTKMNHNRIEDRSIDAIRPRKTAIYEELLADNELRRLHQACCDNHRALIRELLERPEFDALMQGLLGKATA